GEGGIRTHGRISPTHAFQACSLNRSDTSPVCSCAYQFSRISESHIISQTRLATLPPAAKNNNPRNVVGTPPLAYRNGIRFPAGIQNYWCCEASVVLAPQPRNSR